MKYQLSQSGHIIRLADGAFIPNDYANADYGEYLQWVSEGNAPEPADEPYRDLYAEWKAERSAAVAALSVEVDGLVFDGDEESQNRMARAVSAADAMTETTEWTLHDNSVATVTIQQLKTACRLAGEAQTAIWNDGRPAQPV